MFIKSVIKELQSDLPWNEFLENMERSGFITFHSINASKISNDKDYKELLKSGRTMIVNSRVQSLGLNDPSLLSLCPFMIFRPINETQLKSIILESQKFKIPITFAGGKTGLSGGYANYGIIVDMAEFHSLNRPYDLKFQKQQIVVEQGVLVSDLIKVVPLKTNGKFIFPIQPASALKLPVRIGGIIASNASGVTSGKLGATEDWIENLRIMLPNGQIIEIDKKHNLFQKLVGGNGYYGVILSATFRLYRPELKLKRAILYGYDLNIAFNGLQSILEAKIFPLISEFVTSPIKLPGIFNNLNESDKKEKNVKWALMLKGKPKEVNSFIKIMEQQSNCIVNILTEEKFQKYLQERSTFALLIQTTEGSANFIAFPGFEDILSPPKYLPNIIDTINNIFIEKGFQKVIFGYGHINFRKGKGLLLHMRLPVPIEYFYKENYDKGMLICDTIYDVITVLRLKFNIQPKAEHSSGLFKIWLDAEYRNQLRVMISNKEAFHNPTIKIFDKLLVKRFNINLQDLKDYDLNLDEKMKKELFISNMLMYIH